MRISTRRHPTRERLQTVAQTIDDARGKKSVTAILLGAAGFVGLTAASARISSLRRRGAASSSS